MNVVFRADDAGSSEGANRAIVETVRQGVVRNVSVMVPGPAFDHAVPLLRGLDADLGLHVTLSSEWDSPTWGPILPPSRVPTLVEPNGSFTQNPGVLDVRGFSIDEAMAEVAAQLAKARSAGLEIVYLDQHMGVGWIRSKGSPYEEREGGTVGEGVSATLNDALIDFAQREGLVFARLPYFQGLTHDPEALVEALDREENPVVFVTHPGSDKDPVMASFCHEGLQPGQVHQERIADRRLLTHPALVQAVREGRLCSRTYRDVAR